MPFIVFLWIICCSYIGAKLNGRGINMVVINGELVVTTDIVFE